MFDRTQSTTLNRQWAAFVGGMSSGDDPMVSERAPTDRPRRVGYRPLQGAETVRIAGHFGVASDLGDRDLIRLGFPLIRYFFQITCRSDPTEELTTGDVPPSVGLFSYDICDEDRIYVSR